MPKKLASNDTVIRNCDNENIGYSMQINATSKLTSLNCFNKSKNQNKKSPANANGNAQQ